MGIAERKERERQQRREEIVQAAEKVFFSRGFEKATMDDVAEVAELSKGTLYLYFKSKEDLHMAVALKSITMLNNLTTGIRQLKENALGKLVKIGRTCIEFTSAYPDHMNSIMLLEGFELQSLSFTMDEMREKIIRESPIGMVLEIVEQGVEEKLIRNDIPAPLIAHTLWMQMFGVIRFIMKKTALLEMLDLSHEKVYESHFELVMNGIRA